MLQLGVRSIWVPNRVEIKDISYSLDKDDICVGAETEVKHVYYCPLFTPWMASSTRQRLLKKNGFAIYRDRKKGVPEDVFLGDEWYNRFVL